MNITNHHTNTHIPHTHAHARTHTTHTHMHMFNAYMPITLTRVGLTQAHPNSVSSNN